MTELRALHESQENKWYGVDVFEGKPIDMFEKNVLEPLIVKTNAISSAVEAAGLILRIDDIIAATKFEEEKEKEKKGPEEEESESSI